MLNDLEKLDEKRRRKIRDLKRANDPYALGLKFYISQITNVQTFKKKNKNQEKSNISPEDAKAEGKKKRGRFWCA